MMALGDGAIAVMRGAETVIGSASAGIASAVSALGHSSAVFAGPSAVQMALGVQQSRDGRPGEGGLNIACGACGLVAVAAVVAGLPEIAVAATVVSSAAVGFTLLSNLTAEE
jgi:hypothetical protein